MFKTQFFRTLVEMLPCDEIAFLLITVGMVALMVAAGNS